jgi:uncharacterized protein with von Willebrand factor type A (vWA) domain
MSRVTKFAARDPGPSARLAGFFAHLRAHGMRLGVGETETALRALGYVSAGKIEDVRAALKAVASGCADDSAAFDALFDAYWLNAGRVRNRVMPSPNVPKAHTRSSRGQGAEISTETGSADAPDPGEGDGADASDGTGKLQATKATTLFKKDLREVVSAEDIRAAEAVARRVAEAIRDRRSRRRRSARKGREIDFRRVVRQSLSTGGEPIQLPRRTRPDRAARLTVLCDVSGSMTVYARLFLAFAAGLLRTDDTADAYLFHTKLVRITEALRDENPMRAMNRLTLLADGFGGGSRIGHTLDRFANTYARRFVGGRSVVWIFSDGYDTDPPAQLAEALATLKRRGCRIVWLNPLIGWKDYAPVAAGMAAALPYLDLFAPANTLEALAALETEMGKL